jgi:hypothetical protein
MAMDMIADLKNVSSLTDDKRDEWSRIQSNLSGGRGSLY